MIFRLGRLCHEYIAQGILWFLAFVIVLRANGPQRFQIIFLACLGREYVQRNVACGKGKLLFKELSQGKVALRLLTQIHGHPVTTLFTLDARQYIPLDSFDFEHATHKLRRGQHVAIAARTADNQMIHIFQFFGNKANKDIIYIFLAQQLYQILDIENSTNSPWQREMNKQNGQL